MEPAAATAAQRLEAELAGLQIRVRELESALGRAPPPPALPPPVAGPPPPPPPPVAMSATRIVMHEIIRGPHVDMLGACAPSPALLSLPGRSVHERQFGVTAAAGGGRSL
jgi:hypothetical protein